ncbi:MAG: leucine--tRNA ligase [Epulopiscium sp. Nele67-Bin004]|nr:MAG: leucine--tRNA ligase [Epulopiscium sp. Nele67-Bin004]
MDYNYTAIEEKWRKKWLDQPINVPAENKENYYCLDMFPYPSGDGLHVGHWRGYVLSDVWSRYQILQNKYVLHPMGWDAFGLPAENYAIAKKIHPAIATKGNIANFKRQLGEISAVYDWDKEINTTDPNYYKWTQWIFLKMFEEGLAYEKEMPINWCPDCKTGLANEEVKEGTCDRCGSVVTKKNLRQWMLKITAYAEQLLADLDGLNWPEKVKKMQADWIGKSYGAEIDFDVVGTDKKVKVFTTRPDTLYGATFMVVAPESALVTELVTDAQKAEVEKYVFDASTKSAVDRMTDKEKTGVFLGAYATNPLTGKQVPIWTADYVLADYGTGAIMCVPAHDDRDMEFAEKFGLEIITVIDEDNKMVNSDKFNGLDANKAKAEILDYLETENIGKKTVNYKLRDWVFSRQRYWGEPIPIVHCQKCGVVGAKEEDLPITLPDVESYEPTGTGESPLADIEEWVNTCCPKCDGPAKRETNTMPQWAGSSWYFLRYPNPHNDKELISQEDMKNWLPVDMYVGGIEHAVLHLLYARFYTKFLKDIGVVSFSEPFKQLFNQGMVTKDGAKMSKSKGNTVSPDELVRNYGCDSLRMYELFIGPPELDSEWDDSGIGGVHRFLNKLWRLVTTNEAKPATKETERIRHKMIYDITTRMETFSLNTVVSGFMEYTNKLTDIAKKSGGIDTETIKTVITLLAPFVPHISEELWELVGETESVFKQTWPKYDMEKMKEDEIEIIVQVSGKMAGKVTVDAEAQEADILATAKEFLSARLEGKQIVKEIYVKGRLVNIVAK